MSFISSSRLSRDTIRPNCIAMKPALLQEDGHAKTTLVKLAADVMTL